MAEDVKIVLQDDDDNEEEERRASIEGARALSLSMSALKDGGLSSRIPRFNRRASAADTSSPNNSFDASLNKSFESNLGRIKENRLKRHHSIYERGERDREQRREKMQVSPIQMPRELTPTAAKRTKSPTTPRKGLNPLSIKRHKSFSAGERPNVKRLNMASLKTLPVPPNSSSSPTPPASYLTARRGTYHSLDVARKEGIVSMKSTKKTAAVHDPGRVQVFVRIRPPNESEDLSKHSLAISIADEENTQLKLYDGKNDRCYQFDGVIPDDTDNKEVYKNIGEPLVYSALSGFNGILMCYGQTGTGKTYTLMSNDGMSVRVVYQCFKVINSDRRHKYTVNCSYLQIYQEKIYDLLNETRTVDLSLREHPKTGVYIENLTEYVVHSPKEVLNLLKVGKRRLVFAETKMNRASSRSHAIIQLRILKERAGNDNLSSQTSSPSFGKKTPDWDDEDEYYDSHDQLGHSIDSSYNSLIDEDDEDDVLNNVTDLEDGVTSVRGKIYICDLAGSERIKKTKASGERLQEAQHINSSLLELGNVIQALAEGNRSHVPFRNSSLTRLLQEGLSGNCKTRLVVCVAPTVRDVHETKCSLNFGSRAMKVQVMAHVNYEVDYKKLAEALAAKLESLEQEWNVQKTDYERFIAQLKGELGNRRLTSPMESFVVGTKTTPRQVQSLLVIELMTIQLFYNLQGNSQLLQKMADSNVSSEVLLFSPANQDMMLQSMEGLLELLGDYMRDRPPLRSKNYSNQSSSGNSSVITSPDYIEQSGSAIFDVPATLEPVARFLEHAQITSANSQANANTKLDMSPEQRSKERIKSVMNALLQLKDLVSQKAIQHLKETFEGHLEESEQSLLKVNCLDDIVSILDNQKDLLSNFESLDDVQALESSLYYLLMDKALLSCMVLLKTQAGNLLDGWKNSVLPENCDAEVKRVIKELTTERNARDKLQDQLYTCREEQIISEEKLKDIELELKTVRELKDSLESKLHAVEDKNNILEEQIEKMKQEKAGLEARSADIDQRKLQLESSLKNSDNNNARKERIIVDLKNEKVALDSLVSTLKEEISILEKERTRDNEERRQMEEELEDVRDRNIILETEWSCCREENGLLENELTALEEDKAILEDELLKYRDDVKMLEEAVTMLEAQAADYKQDILSLKTKEDRLLANIRTEKEKFNKEMNTLRQEMSTLRVERRRFQRDISVSRADKSNTERAYNALKVQKDSLQDDVSLFKQEEKRLQREITLLKNDRAKLEREVNGLKTENAKLKKEIVQADKLKVELKLLQKNEENISSAFSIEKDKLVDTLVTFKDKFNRMEQDFAKICTEKDKLSKQLKRFEQTGNDRNDANTVRRSQSQPTNTVKVATPDKGRKLRPSASVQGALVRRSVHSGEVSEVEGKVLDLQRRLAFFMAEKEDIKKELITTRERNATLTSEIKCLEDDTSKIQTLLYALADEKECLESKLCKVSETKIVIEKERDELKQAVLTAQETTSHLQNQLEEVTEQNRVLEVDQLTVRESVKTLQNETVVLATENKHIKMEFENVDNDLQMTRSIVENLNEKLAELKTKVKDAGENENSLKQQLSILESENLTLSEQVSACEQEEELLVKQLLDLRQKIVDMESLLEKVLIERIPSDQPASKEVLTQMQDLKEANSLLEQIMLDLKAELETVVFDAESLKEERAEIEKLLQEAGDNTIEAPLTDNIRHLKAQVLKVKQEKVEIEEKMKLLEVQMRSVGHENVVLHHHVSEKSSRLEQEKANYKYHIDQLQQQIEELVKERIQLEAEVKFLKKQNAELRKEIAIILDDNTKLESELEGIDEQFEKQEKELFSATEETKLLLRELCAAETKNLNLCTLQSSHQDDLEEFKSQIEKLKHEKDKIGEEKLDTEVQTKTLKERLIMAELEISQLKLEHSNVESQRKLLAEDLDAADRERFVLKSELEGLARALSPLKKEVTEVMKKQETLQNGLSQEGVANVEISNELVRIKEDLSTFNAEKAALESEQGDLESRLKHLGDEKEDLRKELRHLIQDLDDRNQLASKDQLTEMEESIRMVSELITKKEDLGQEKSILSDDLLDARYTNQMLNICVNNSTEQLRSAQEELCLATVDRLKLKDRTRHISRSVSDIQDGNDSRKSGLSPLQYEVHKLKTDIETFQKSQENLLCDVRSLNDQLNMADNNLVNVVHFKTIIEKNLRLYKERNNKLESHLRVIYNDLIEMESHSTTVPSTSAKVLLETLDLHRHFQSLEEDLRDTESQNRTLKEDSSDLLERCTALEEEKQLNTVSSGYLQDSMYGQHTFIAQLQKEKETLAYEKTRLTTKLSLYKDDKKRILEDFHRLNKSLGAYARYNHELEKKLKSFKVDLSELECKADLVSEQKQKMFVSAISSNGHSSDLLCEHCLENVNRKFLGFSNNTQLLGDELLDCINDNLSLETAIFSFMDQKAGLEQELVHMESDQRDLERILFNERNISAPRWSGSQSSINSEFSKRVWPSGRLSTRSKSMTSHSGESFTGDDDLRVTAPSRSHTALGIYKSPCASSSRTSSLNSSTSPTSIRAATTSPTSIRAATASPEYSRQISLSPKMDYIRKMSSDEAYESEEGVNIMPDENSNFVCLNTLHEGHADGKETLAHGKSKSLSGFLKKFRTSKRSKK